MTENGYTVDEILKGERIVLQVSTFCLLSLHIPCRSLTWSLCALALDP
jgi:hypothetical protein